MDSVTMSREKATHEQQRISLTTHFLLHGCHPAILLTAETERKVATLLSGGGNASDSSELLDHICALKEEVRLLQISEEVPEALVAQQQRILSRAAESLAARRQQISLSRPFSFKRGARVDSEAVQKIAVRSEATEIKTDCPAENTAGRNAQDTTNTPCDVLSISNLTSRVILVAPGVAGGREVWLKNLDGCTVYIVDRVPCARLQNIRDSAVLTTGAVFAPSIFFMLMEGINIQTLPHSNAWRDVKDFDWIKRQASAILHF
ncbi:hypothetical protein, conserved [Eimeria tenella]|uniref:Uncharacterized protein n=1 Tax=Eimeria tenella TaxID=5802 RepID=U6L5P2_EIMTE|nr:hypothetical protein, conserved [Eimeria tenella]CDJ45461.1 hypothetical protein, conserved [Eimeria tenella]|eukprot:XP_013236207.1 hypothetical protein, conserved [Eimeria tenella]